MKLLFTALLALAAFSQTSRAESLSVCQEMVKGANESTLQAKDRFNVGEVTITEVASAEVNELNVRFECHNILMADYCAAIVPKVAFVYEGVKEEAAVGQRTMLELSAAKLQLTKLKGLCQ